MRSMDVIKRVLVIVLISTLSIVPAVAGGARESAAPGIVIGYQSIPNGELVAKYLGWHEESLGARVSWVQFSSGSELNTAVASGSVDIGLGGSSTTVVAMAQDLPARVIWVHDIIGENEALVVRKGGGIESVRDLAGKTVAAPFGATTHYHLLMALQLAGVDPGSLRILDMPPIEMLAAWTRGDIDAGFVWEPTLAAMLENGGRVLVSSGSLAKQGYLTGDIGIVRRGFAEEHPEIVVKYIRNQIRAIALIRSNPEAASSAIAAELSLDKAEALRQMNTLLFLDGDEQLAPDYMGTSKTPGALVDVFMETAGFLAAQDTIDDVPNRRAVIDFLAPEFLEQAVK